MIIIERPTQIVACLLFFTLLTEAEAVFATVINLLSPRTNPMILLVILEVKMLKKLPH